MTVITLSTVGLQVKPLSDAGKIFTVALLVLGLGVVFYSVGAIARIVVEGEFQQFFGRRRMEKRIGSLHDHYLVCGFGRIGEAICRELASKPVPFVVIESWEERARKAEEAQYLVLQGDASKEDLLLAGGVRVAKGLFAALATDAENVFVTLTAKELNPALFIVARAEGERSERTLVHAGADKVISPYAMRGHRMAQSTLRPAVVDIIELATHHQSLEIQMEEIAVPPHSPCAGTSIRDSELGGQLGVILVAIKRASGVMLFNPAPEEKIDAGDRLIVMADPLRLKEAERRAGVNASGP
jgi:voltage-gated potassium channel